MEKSSNPSVKAAPEPGQAAAPRTLSALELLGSGNVVQIEHLGQVYRLSLTRQGKLILTK
jgi:hemin uptake protein HemP